MKKNRLIVVLGMHRSGTSVIARGLQVFGVDLGDRLFPAMEGVNDKGFWEDSEIVQLNIDLMNALGHDWYSLRPIHTEDWTAPTIINFKQHALGLLREKMSNTECFGFKDPRTARLLPFWQQVFKELQLDVGYVIACRNPISVARSLVRRDDMDARHAGYLWLDHMLTSLTQTRGQVRVVVDYDLLMANPVAQMQRIAECLKLSFEPDGEAFAEFKNEFLEESLRHAKHGLEDLKRDPDMLPSVVELYEVLYDLATDDLSRDVVSNSENAEYLSQIYFDNVDARHLLRAYDANIDSFARELIERDRTIVTMKHQILEKHKIIKKTLEENERAISALHMSRSWRITKPLRFFSELLKGR